jgi:hypothetical protein
MRDARKGFADPQAQDFGQQSIKCSLQKHHHAIKKEGEKSLVGFSSRQKTGKRKDNST